MKNCYYRKYNTSAQKWLMWSVLRTLKGEIEPNRSDRSGKQPTKRSLEELFYKEVFSTSVASQQKIPGLTL